MGSNRTRGDEVYQLCSVHAVGLNSQTGTEGSSVSSLICDRWLRLNSEAFNRCLCCQEDTDAAVCVGCARCLACPLPSSKFGLDGVGRLLWRTPALSGTEKQPWYRLGMLASISTKPLPLTTHAYAHTKQHHVDTPGMRIGPMTGLSGVA